MSDKQHDDPPSPGHSEASTEPPPLNGAEQVRPTPPSGDAASLAGAGDAAKIDPAPQQTPIPVGFRPDGPSGDSSADAGRLASPAAPVQILVVVATFDLGGDVVNAEALTDALIKAGFPDAQVSSKLDDMWDTAFLVTRQRPVSVGGLEHDGVPPPLRSSIERSSSKVTIFPTGVITIVYEIELRAGSSLADAADLARAFRSAKNQGYPDYLRAVVASLADNKATGEFPFGSQPEWKMVDTIRHVAEREINKRPFTLMPFGTKYVYASHTLADHDDVTTRWLREFATLQGNKLVVGPETLLAQAHRDQRVATWDAAVLASWGGREFYALARDDQTLETIVDCFEISETYRLVVRIWLDYLDGKHLELRRGKGFTAKELASLQGELIEDSMLRQRIANSMAGLDAVDLAAKDNFRRQVMHDLAVRLHLRTINELIDRRLAALDQHNATVASVLDRAFQNAARKQSNRLQALFAGAVVASLAALIPALAQTQASGHQRPLIEWTIGVVVVGWIVLVLAVQLISAVKLRFPSESRRSVRAAATPRTAYVKLFGLSPATSTLSDESPGKTAMPQRESDATREADEVVPEGHRDDRGSG
jgi:hypothetical protein